MRKDPQVPTTVFVMTSQVVQLRRPVPVWTFADRVRKARRSTGMTQAAFAQALGVGDKAYAAWESGANEPEHLHLIAERLETVVGWDKAWFLGWADESTPRPDGPGGGGRARRDSNPQPSDPKVVVTAFGRIKKVASDRPAAAAA